MKPLHLAALCILVARSVAFAQQPAADPDRISPNAKFSQSDAVRARYPDIPVALTAPSLEKPAPALTTQPEMEAFLATRIAPSPHAFVTTLGTSAQGRGLPLVLLSKEGVKSLADASALSRPVVWFIGQQHGNEPAGGEAMLALANALANGPLTPMLDRMTIAIIPRANPDGAAADRRGVANGADLNRDHILLTLQEAQAIHGAMQQLPPDVVFDHHEFSVANRWVEKFGGIQKADAMVLAATNPMVTPEVRALANELFQPRVEAAMAKYGLVPVVYVTTSYSKADFVVSTGGTAPGIARNTFGLSGAISYLVETRGVGIGMEGWQRRVATHYLIAEAVLNAVADGGPPLLQRLAAGRQTASTGVAPLAVAASLKTGPVPFPFVDPVTGEDKLVTVTLKDSRELTITRTRPRPTGYFITDAIEETAARLTQNRVRLCRLAAAVEVDVESFSIAAPPKASSRESINPEQAVTVELVSRRRRIPAGSLYLPMSQPASGILSAALEPDSPGSFVGTGLLPVRNGEAPVLRFTGTVAGAQWPGCAF